MHCADPGCLKACPAPGAIVQYSNGIVDFIEEHCIGCGSCITGCPFNVPRISKQDNKAYKCTLCSDRVVVGLEPACVKTCPTGAITFGSKEDMKRARRRAHRRPEEPRLPECRPVRSAGRRRHARDVRAEACRQAGDLPRACPPIRTSARWCRCGRARSSRSRSRRWASRHWRACSITCKVGPKEPHDDEPPSNPRPPAPLEETNMPCPPNAIRVTLLRAGPRTGCSRSLLSCRRSPDSRSFIRRCSG